MHTARLTRRVRAERRDLPAIAGEESERDMGVLSIAPRATDDASIARALERFERRIEATPPGTCPVAVQASLLEAAAAQTCGKCVPCRDGLPQLAQIMRRVRDCQADVHDLEQLRALATLARDASDCAIGYEAGQAVLDGLEAFAAEYESHLEQHRCQAGSAKRCRARPTAPRM